MERRDSFFSSSFIIGAVRPVTCAGPTLKPLICQHLRQVTFSRPRSGGVCNRRSTLRYASRSPAEVRALLITGQHFTQKLTRLTATTHNQNDFRLPRHTICVGACPTLTPALQAAGDLLNHLAELWVFLSQTADRLTGMQHGAVVPAAEVPADLLQAMTRQFTGQVHADLAG